MNAVDEYIESFEGDTLQRLQEIREMILGVLQEAEEVINYGIPTYQLKGKNVVHFGGFKNHIGFYPAPSGISKFQDELSSYKGAKGSVQFPHKNPLPKDLIIRITKFRLEETREKYGL